MGRVEEGGWQMHKGGVQDTGASSGRSYLRHDRVGLPRDFAVLGSHVVGLQDPCELVLRDHAVAILVEDHETELELVVLARA